MKSPCILFIEYRVNRMHKVAGFPHLGHCTSDCMDKMLVSDKIITVEYDRNKPEHLSTALVHIYLMSSSQRWSCRL